MNTNLPLRRQTRQRQQVLTAVSNLGHPTADAVFGWVRKKVPQISRNTVYRNLNILMESGDIERIVLPGQATRYETWHKPHAHFVCKRCGDITNIILPRTSSSNGNYLDLQTSVNVIGYCQKCLKELKPVDISVDKHRCTAAADCTKVAPQLFTLKGAIAEYRGRPKLTNTLIKAAHSCPVQAIVIHDKSGKQIYP